MSFECDNHILGALHNLTVNEPEFVVVAFKERTSSNRLKSFFSKSHVLFQIFDLLKMHFTSQADSREDLIQNHTNIA